MPLLNYLKTGLRNRRFHTFFLFFTFFGFFLIFGAGENVVLSQNSYFFTDPEGQVVICLYPEDLSESRLKGNILKGGKSEISIRFRLRKGFGKYDVSLPRTQEFHIRKTGYRDIITGDFVLMVNGRETGTFRDWKTFYQNFSMINNFPIGRSLVSGESPDIRYQIEVVYKKFVAPLNLLYLIPGKYITKGRWIDLKAGPVE